MYDVDLSVLDKILTVSKEKIESKATKSVKKSVTNLKPFLKEEYQFEKTADFRDALICEVYQVNDLQEIEDKRVDLTKKDEQNIEQIVQNRYANDDWVYGETPRFSVKRRIRLPKVGIVDVRLSTLHGRINEIRFYGDFFGQKDVSILEQQLLGQKFIYEEIKNALNDMTVSDYIFHFNNEDLLALLF